MTIEVDLVWWSAVNVRFYTGILHTFMFQKLNMKTPDKLIKLKSVEGDMIARKFVSHWFFGWNKKNIKLPNYGWQTIWNYHGSPRYDSFIFEQNISLYRDHTDLTSFQPSLNFIIDKNNKSWRLTRVDLRLFPFNINYIFRGYNPIKNLLIKVWNANRGSFHFKSKGIKVLKIEGLVMKFRKQ